MAADETAAATDPYVCEHCDESVPHRHVDERPLVDRYRRDLGRALAALVALLAVAVAGCVAALATGALPGSWGVPAGAIAWLLAAGVGVGLWRLLLTRRPAKVAVVAGAIATSAVSPVLALALAAAVEGPPWYRALTAGAGWLGASLVLELGRTRTLRDLLTRHTREGEAARLAVVRSLGRPSPYTEAVWLALTAVTFGLCVAAAAWLPVLVVVLVPLNVALAVLTRRWRDRPGPAPA